MIKTFCFKLYNSKRNRKLHKQINAACIIYNHCIALHKRYYRLFKRSLSANKLKVHLTKLNKISRFSYLKEIGSQAVQDVAERIDRSYKQFFAKLKLKTKASSKSFPQHFVRHIAHIVPYVESLSAKSRHNALI